MAYGTINSTRLLDSLVTWQSIARSQGERFWREYLAAWEAERRSTHTPDQQAVWRAAKAAFDTVMSAHLARIDARLAGLDLDSFDLLRPAWNQLFARAVARRHYQWLKEHDEEAIEAEQQRRRDLLGARQNRAWMRREQQNPDAALSASEMQDSIDHAEATIARLTGKEA